ncbi:MAG: efflux RND transporter periplasmic adaptor subunit [Acidobacteriota bacterium]
MALQNKRRRFLLLAGGAAVVTVSAGWLTIARFAAEDDVPVFKVRREAFVHEVTAEGVLKAAQSTPLTAPATRRGPMRIAWMIEDGSPVQAGDVVVRFDPTDMEKKLLDGKVELATAESKIKQKRTESDAAVKNLTRDADLARQELDMAGEFQSKDPEIFSRADIIESEIDEKLAARRVEHAERSRTTRQTLSKAEIDLLAIERRKAELKIQQARQGLTALEIRAPHDGIVVFRRDWLGNIRQVGDVVMRAQPLAEIPALDEMEAEVHVLEADAGGLSVGRPAVVVLEADQGASYNAEIKHVESLPKPRVRGVPVQYFAVTLKLERTEPAMMRPGQRVRATLMLDKRPQALVVPRQAVFENENKKIVYRRRKGRFEPVEVTLGPSSIGRIVVEEGLDEDDVIALRDPTMPGRVPTPTEKQPPKPPLASRPTQ